MTYPKDSDEDSTESDVNPPNQMMAVGSIGIKLSVDGLDTHDGISRNEKVSASAAIQALLHTLVYIKYATVPVSTPHTQTEHTMQQTSAGPDVMGGDGRQRWILDLS